ncbi:2-succinyl-5-enolpyruvyl-6-hydroxy-3-cyclohexene-1-carboxylate synthase [Microbacterium sp. NC79]|nr:thiamine pyrophosphate-binding protein [Microbacterium sp. NC79]MBV0894004.1 2-succinyl-5-enolpyruvyl-6-hydroxy-3-cyclohexene-1-carboxylate synthase [Microbacterium sp. NC79]
MASAATDAAHALLDELIRQGLRDIVVCPGSRSQALALAAAAEARAGRVRLHVRIDERVAGFTALGLGRETGVPAAVVVTSGTGVANLAPAVWEAHHSAVPLLLLTADRPEELRGIGANQATVQPGAFTSFVRAEWDAPTPTELDNDGSGSAAFRALARSAFAAATGTTGSATEGSGTTDAEHRAATDAGTDVSVSVPGPAVPASASITRSDVTGSASVTGSDVIGSAAALGATATAVPSLVPTPGPVHVNLPFRDPLSGEPPAWTKALEHVEHPEALERTTRHVVALERGPRTVVIAGADAGADAEEISHAGSWPLIAEIVSGARYGRLLVHGYRALLRDPDLGGRIERAIVFGHPTLSREVTRLLSNPAIDVIAVRTGGVPLNLNGTTRHADAVTVARGSADREWLGAFMTASREQIVDLSAAAPDLDGLASLSGKARRAALDAELAAVRAPLTRELLADAVWRATWPHDRLVFGSSRLVRVADAVLGGKKVPVHANRGLAGIDGTIATALGIAIASQGDGSHGMTRVLLGDLTFLHDVGALLLPADEPEPRIQLIVGNDGGGTIFDGLEVASVASAEDMTRVQYTPQNVDLERIATAYGWGYRRVSTRSELDQALTTHTSNRQIIEVSLPRD